jgi:hypothetical protein
MGTTCVGLSKICSRIIRPSLGQLKDNRSIHLLRSISFGLSQQPSVNVRSGSFSTDAFGTRAD